MILSLSDLIHDVLDHFKATQRFFLGFDYDGTLAPIVDDPRKADLSQDVRNRLSALAAHPSIVVAIVSGRGLDDLRSRVKVPGIIYGGNHGLDISGPGIRFVEPNALALSDKLISLAEQLVQRLRAIPGAEVENKGLTLSVHFRRVAISHVGTIHRAVESILADGSADFRTTLGRKVIEIRPRTEWHKGHAVLWIRNQCLNGDSLGCFFGDDQTDEDVFAAVPEWITVKVGTPGESGAKYYVESSLEVNRILEQLASIVSGWDIEP